MKVIHSIGAKFAGPGIGTTAYYEALGAYKAGCLKKVLCTHYIDSEIDRKFITSLGLVGKGLKKLGSYNLWLDIKVASLFDRWAARRLNGTDVFHGWALFSLSCLKRAKKNKAVTFLEYASSHILTQKQLVESEYKKLGLRYEAVPNYVIKRLLEELEECDFVHIPSDFVKQSFLEQGYPQDKLVVIPFGVDLHKFKPALRKKDRTFRVLFVGQVCLRKGVQYLFKAWQKLNWNEAELLIVGQVQSDFKHFANGRKLELKGVRFINFTPNIVDLYQEADVFVFPTVEEGSALVTYEALACGLPVITTFNAGSVVRDGQEGFIIPLGDVKVLAEKLEQLCQDTQLREEMSKAARQRAEQFSWQKMGERLVSAYRQALTAKH